MKTRKQIENKYQELLSLMVKYDKIAARFLKTNNNKQAEYNFRIRDSYESQSRVLRWVLE